MKSPIMVTIGSVFLVIAIILLISGFLYLKVDWFRRISIIRCIFHDIFGWHIPDENVEKTFEDDDNNVLDWNIPDKNAEKTFDGARFHCICEICHKEIMPDSQGNWF